MTHIDRGGERKIVESQAGQIQYLGPPIQLVVSRGRVD